VPILLLSLEKDDLATNREPLMLNLTAVRLAQPGIVTLIHRVRARLGIEAEWLTSMDTDSPRLELPLPSAATPTEVAPAYLPAEKTPTQAVPIPALATNSTQKGKLLSGLTAVERITKELREPLSNMNLAIHMLEKEQSLEKRDHYLSLLREEYQRELQLVNELELVQASLQALL
jgi:signal transduction histidine kinase